MGVVEPGPIRRIVAGNDERGRSRVIFDGAAHDANPSMGGGRTYNDFWIWKETPAPLAASGDAVDFGYDFPGPGEGGHLRIVQGIGSPKGYHWSGDDKVEPLHPPKEDGPTGRMWSRGGRGPFSSHMHKTQTIDYAVLVDGGRELELDDDTVILNPGDFVLDVGAWHRWHTPQAGSMMAFDMIVAEFVDGPIGLLQGHATPIVAAPGAKLPEGVKPARRVVVGDVDGGRSKLISDGASPDVSADPARPGYAATRLWVIDRHPAPLLRETLHLPKSLVPPKSGSVYWSVTIPPDDAWKGRVGSKEVAAWYASMNAPAASAYETSAPHPYMQKTGSMDFCLMLEGEATLVLDEGEVTVGPRDVVVLLGARHAWSNRSGAPAVMAVMSHDGK